MLEDRAMLFTEEHANRFVLEEIDKIIRERWRIIERTTRYGWIAACSRGSTMSRKDAEKLSAIAGKIGYDGCKEAFRRVRNACRDEHPINVPRIAMAILDETYTAVMFNDGNNVVHCLQQMQTGIEVGKYNIARSAANGIYDFQRYIFKAIHNTGTLN